MQPEWRRLESGTSPTNKTIYFSDFQRMRILLPPTEEQQMIADAGERFDRTIESETNVRQQLVQVKAATMQGLFGGGLELGG